MLPNVIGNIANDVQSYSQDLGIAVLEAVDDKLREKLKV